jgi:hypothetical protein
MLRANNLPQTSQEKDARNKNQVLFTDVYLPKIDIHCIFLKSMARILDEYLYLGGLTNKNQIFEATTIRRSRWLRLFVLKRKNQKKHPQPSA